MEVDVARWLVSRSAAGALAAAEAEPDPASLAAAVRVRTLVPPERAAAALSLVALRRKAIGKLGAAASGWFLTAEGLEQATRPAVASRRAARFRSAGVPGVLDLTTGIGVDAVAFRSAGLLVRGVEADPATAVLAAANLERLAPQPGSPGPAEVLSGLAEDADLDTLPPDWGVFADPARRTERGRSWRVEDLRPSWSFVASLLDGRRTACLKLGPGFPDRLIPAGVEAEWVSDARTVVELALWAGPGSVPWRRAAVVDGEALLDDGGPEVEAGHLGGWLHEPDGAVVRAGLVGAAARRLGAHRVHPDVAYLTGPHPSPDGFVTSYEVVEVLPLKRLRLWVREHGVGVLEIKKRGLDTDPAVLRRQLRLAGPNAATVILSPTPAGAAAIVVRRASRP